MSIELKQEAQRALEALEEIALAGMSGTGQESEEGMRDWHARQAWKFIGIAARALDPLRTAIRQAEVTDQQAEVTDQLIESEFQRCGGKWNGDQWVIEDADLHPFCRAILALRPVQVPMTREQAMAIAQSNPDTMTAIRMTEAHHGITAQAKKETP